MKAKVNIRDIIEENADHGQTLHVNATFDVDEFFEVNCILEEHEFDIDLHELLAENRRIAHVWGTEDVQSVRPDLTDDQAWQVLQTVEKHLDSTCGITWETIENTADELYDPKP